MPDPKKIDLRDLLTFGGLLSASLGIALVSSALLPTLSSFGAGLAACGAGCFLLGILGR